ncbi:MAG: NHL repeat-containing protein [Nitrospirota bacterium]
MPGTERCHFSALKNNYLPGKSLLRKSVLITIFSLFFILDPILHAESASGIRLTNVKHLFNISHDFNQPSDVSVSNKGFIYVLDGVNNKVKVFDQEGNHKFSFGRKGSSKGSFSFPLGIDIDDSGKVYVADSGNHRVQIFGPEGNFISQVNVPAKNNNPSDPTDVVANQTVNRLYVIDNNNHCFLIFDLSTFQLLGTYGSPGMERTEFRYPFLAAIDSDNHLYITDVVNTRVQEFTEDGKFVNIIGGWGVEKGEFFRPKGIAIDSQNRIYVSDSYMGVIQVFKNNGELYSAIGYPEKGKVRKFIKPMGIFVDSKNRLYVVEMFAERVSVYSIEENEK